MNCTKLTTPHLTGRAKFRIALPLEHGTGERAVVAAEVIMLVLQLPGFERMARAFVLVGVQCTSLPVF